jgi:putative membrane-bound dehydrogenase-like protein
MLPFRRLAIAALLFAPPAAALAVEGGEPVPHNQDRPPNDPLSPAEAIKRMAVLPGFSVELVAAEPDVVNPVAMTFDEKGRIWVTESFEYPRQEPGPGRDRVKVLEDTDGDGKVDKTTIFADDLNIPSAIAVGHGGVWVANAPDILFLQDTDGDGRADKREVVVTGFGRFDTHELPNSFIWGPDGWLYGLNGVFNPAEIKHQGRTHKFTAAMFRIHPRTRAFEVFAEGTSNPWGIAFNRAGSSFLSACVIDHLWHLVESGYYHRQAGAYPPNAWKIESIVDFKHQKAAYCGITYYDSDAYPAEYRGKLFMGNIHGNCINSDGLERSGSGYRGTNQPDFLTANDAWFMPVVQKTGPDGCLYVLDWYDRYHCYQDANRDPAGIDRGKGRLYRVRHESSPRPEKAADASAFSDDELLAWLAAPNSYRREIAQRLFAERDKDETRAKLEAVVLQTSLPTAARLDALHARLGSGPLGTEFHAKLLADSDPAVRAWGVRAVGNARALPPTERELRSTRDEVGRAPVPAREVGRPIEEAVVALADDPSPDVALQVAIAARKLPTADAVRLLARVLRRPSDDGLIPHIVWENLHPTLPHGWKEFVKEIDGVDLARAPMLAKVMPRVASVIPLEGLPDFLGSVLKSEPLPIELARSCLASTRARLNGLGAKDEALEEVRDELLEVLRDHIGRKEGDHLGAEPALVAALLRDEAARKHLRALIAREDAPAHAVEASLDVLVRAGDPEVLILARPRLLSGSVESRGQVLAILARLDTPDVATSVLSSYGEMEAGLKPRAIELLTQRPAWGHLLAESIRSGKIDKGEVNLNQVRKLQSSPDKKLAEHARAIWGVIREGRNPDRERVIAEIRGHLAKNPGDASRGPDAFKKICAQCHKIYGEGQDVGPDITSNGRGSFEQLLSNVLDPSLVIGEAYQATTILTADGRVLQGVVVEDSPERVALKLQGGKTETIPRDEIEELKRSELSLMPEKLEEQLTPQELADLFEYLRWDRPPGTEGAKRIPAGP